DLAAYCFENRETVILSDLDVLSDEGMQMSSVMAVPIKLSDQCLGVMIVINKTSGGNFSAEDKDALERLLNFVAVAIDNSRMLKDKLKQQKIRQEMMIARQIQETLLPVDLENIEGVDIGAIYYPAREVGGDFYDIIKIDQSRFYLVIGDVSNKGVPAAMIMSAASGILKAILRGNPEITVSELASTLNDAMVEEIIKDREMFVTMFFCKFDIKAGKLTYCNAGHLPGLFWEDESQKVHQLPDGGPIVGQFGGIPYRQGERELRSGDRLFVFTDGLTEAADADNNLFGRERVEQVFSAEIGLSPKEFCHRVKDWVDRFAEGAPEDTQDDFTILQVKVN
ncbi:MAG: PP2C family protein-serine/threonine phosphatase, partial [Candidatus Zixiibacteriota bacterium]